MIKTTTKTRTLALSALLLAASVAHADDRKFSAADVPAARLSKSGRIVISNDSHSITAYHFFGDVKEALVSLRSTKTLATKSFGSSLFESNATLTTPMPAYLSATIAEAAHKHGIDPRLVAAVASRESAYNPAAVSPVGACGVMQLMPATARFLGVTNIFDTRENVFAGARYLRTLLDTFHGDLDLSLAAYNAGPGAVQRYKGVPPYPETQAYVRHIRAAYEKSLLAQPVARIAEAR